MNAFEKLADTVDDLLFLLDAEPEPLEAVQDELGFRLHTAHGPLRRELESLRDDLELTIATAPDPLRAVREALEARDEACRAAIAVQREVLLERKSGGRVLSFTVRFLDLKSAAH